jgi:hypothetical protein
MLSRKDSALGCLRFSSPGLRILNISTVQCRQKKWEGKKVSGFLKMVQCEKFLPQTVETLLYDRQCPQRSLGE